MAIIQNGQVAWFSGVVTPSTPAIWTNIYAVYNADSTGSSPLKTSLVSVYNGESNTNDSFGSNNGTPMGGLTYTTGKIGNAFTGNGSNAYVSVPTDSWNSTIGGDFSVSVWVNLTNVSTQQVIISNLSSISGQFQGWDLRVQSGILKFNLWRYDIGTLNSSTTIVANTWYHIVITRKAGGAMNIYVNNSKTTTTSITNDPIINSTHYPTICAIQYNTTKALYLSNNSKIDSVNLWNRELSDLEVTELYNSGNGSQYITDNFYKPTTNDALNTYNGTAQGGLTYGVGKVGTAFVFNGTNSYVELPDNSFNFTDDFTASAWVYLPTNTRTNIGIIGNYNFGENGGWGLTTNSTGTLYARVANETGKYSASASSAIVINDWTHVVMVFKKGTGFYAYANGVLVAQFTLTNNASAGKSPNPSTKARIGLLNYSGDWWWMPNGGRIDACNVWNRALTASEITELYNSGNGKQYPN